MKRTTGRQPSIQSVIDLLQNSEFCEDAWRIIEEAKKLYAQGPPPEEWQRLTADLVQPFQDRWGVVPPTTGELLDADPRRGPVDAIGSGRWGIVLVSAETTDREIRARIKKIRGVIRKQHRDALDRRRVQLARWLEELQGDYPHFNRSAIARAVSGRRTGLRRPTTAEAIAGISWNEEQRLTKQYREAGVPDNKIDQRIFRQLRGSEAPASAALRMSLRRDQRRLEQLTQALATPIQSEPLSHMLSLLFLALSAEDNAAVKQHALAVQAACVAVYADAQPRLRPLLGDGLLGLVLVFPWTTDADVRAQVQAIRVRLRAKRENRDGVTRVPQELNAPSPCEALLLLFRALSEGDELKIKQVAVTVRASFLKASAS